MAEGKMSSQNRNITVGIDARTFSYDYSVARGIGHYTQYHLQFLARQAPRWRFVCYGYDPPARALTPVLGMKNVSFRSVEEYDPKDIDLFHIPDPMHLAVGFDSPFRIFPHPVRTALFHDLIPLRLYWDQWPAVNRNAYEARLEQIRQSDTLLLTNSQTTRNDVLEVLDLPPDRAHTVYAGLNRQEEVPTFSEAEISQIKEKHGLTKPYFLHVGALDPHKNFDAVLRSYRRCARERDCQLVVVGKKDHHLAAQAKECEKRGEADVVFPGYIPRRELEILYREATALVFLSRYEGFGLPILEAMANHCPVITSDTGALAEVASDAAWRFDPCNVWGISQAMTFLLDCPQAGEQLRESGKARSREFTWERTASRTLSLWKEQLTERQAIPTENPNSNHPKLRSFSTMNITTRLNKLCQAADFEPLESYSRQLGCPYNPGKEVRKVWELSMAICTFTECVPPGEIRALGVGAGNETTTFWLTNHCDQVHCTDIYADSGSWEADASPEMLIDPASAFQGFEWNPRRLIVQHMDGCNLRYEDETFDFIYSSSSIEHFGELQDVCRAMAEMGRVLKPGGVLSLSTEFKVRGPGKGFDNVMTFSRDDLCRLIEASGLRMLDELDLTPDPAKEVSFVQAIQDVDRHGIYQQWPHIKLEHRGYVWTSVHLALLKPTNEADHRGLTVEDWEAKQARSQPQPDESAVRRNPTFSSGVPL